MSGNPTLTIPTTVVGLQGRGVSQTVPTGGQPLVYAGGTNEWTPGAPATLVGATIMGVTDGSNAAPGVVGEFISAVQTAGVSCPDSIPTVVAQVALGPGDWEVSGEVWFTGSSGAISTSAIVNTLPTYPTVPAANASFTTVGTVVGPGTDRIPTSPSRILTSTALTAFLVGMGVGGTATAFGRIGARRMR